MLKTTIIGASGYTGAELVRILHHHPQVEIRALVADSTAGQPISAIYPHFAGLDLPGLPAHLADLFEREERYSVIANDLGEVSAFISAALGQQALMRP